MNIVMIASEAVPFAKTGGLADVVHALPKALGQEGHEVTIFLPYYRSIRSHDFAIEPTGTNVCVRIDGQQHIGVVHRASLEKGVTVYLIECEHFFGRNHLYQDSSGDYSDNAQRFTFFSRAALDAILAMGMTPDVIHAHDWQGAMALYLARTVLGGNPPLDKAKTVLTIHNIGYQGLFPKKALDTIGLDDSHFSMDKLEFYGKVNFLKGGIIAADQITTVSKKHAEEILTEEYGFGLDGILRSRRRNLRGIINGLDEQIWNPATDPLIERSFTPDDLSGKDVCRDALRKKLNLPHTPSAPIISMVGRLTVQKGIELLIDALPAIMERDVQLVILGTGEEKYHRMLKSAASDYRMNMNLQLAFDNKLAHQIEAGSDIFLMPSLYEPCGLNQMISMKYGTIPVVRATGGLDDTVVKFNPRTWRGNGFKFKQADHKSFARSVHEAVNVWEQPVLRNKLIKNAMEGDFSWTRISKEYESVYRN
jgi:starch synthase